MIYLCNTEQRDVIDISNNLNEIYLRHIEKETSCLSRETIDFMGINFDLSTKSFSMKTYYMPSDDFENTATKVHNAVIEYAIQKGICRFVWDVRDETSVRNYFAVVHRCRENMVKLFRETARAYPFITKYKDEIVKLSQYDIRSTFSTPNVSPAYILGFKDRSGDSVVNIEWVTRKCPDPDDIGYEYYYDDSYFLNFIKSTQIDELVRLSDKIAGLIKCSKADIHLWFFAADYAKETVKYKIYVKGEGCKRLLMSDLLVDLLDVQVDEASTKYAKEFCDTHSELYLHGFALCLDISNHWSINCYYKIT